MSVGFIRRFFLNFFDAFKNLSRNFPVTLASVISIMLSLFVFGVVFCIIINVNSMATTVKEQFNSLQVFVDNDATVEEQQNIASFLENNSEIQSYEFKSSETAMDEFRVRMGKNAYIFDGLPNFLENSYVVHLKDMKKSKLMAYRFNELDGISDVVYYQDIMTKLIHVSQNIAKIGFLLMLFLAVISFFIISSTIKIAIHAREREIEIMKYIGATNWYIRWPFVIEGILIGILGALTATLAIYLSYGFVQEKVIGENVLLLPYIVDKKVVAHVILNIFLIIGSGIGAVGSLLSLRRYLKV